MLVKVFQWNVRIRRFNSTVKFVENNQIITASRIQKFSICVTMNKLSTNNDLNLNKRKERTNGYNLRQMLQHSNNKITICFWQRSLQIYNKALLFRQLPKLFFFGLHVFALNMLQYIKLVWKRIESTELFTKIKLTPKNKLCYLQFLKNTKYVWIVLNHFK